MYEYKSKWIVSGIFGEEAAKLYDHSINITKKLKKEIIDLGGSECFRYFDTQKEAEAYELGLMDHADWYGFTLTTQKHHEQLFGKFKMPAQNVSDQKERGAAAIHINLQDGEITVRHTTNKGQLLYQKIATAGDWDRIWGAIKQVSNSKNVLYCINK